MEARRSLLEDDMPATGDQRDGPDDDVFGDEFEVGDFDGMVADGFRPGMGGDLDDERRMSPMLHHDAPIRTLSAHYSPQPISPPRSPPPRSPVLSRNSTRKCRGGEPNPFVSPDDEDETSPLDPGNTLQFEPDDANLRRSGSSASSRIYANTHSPRFGAAGPSHPYALYQQGTVARSPSVTTTGTIRPSRQSMVPGGPQHPYAMYPQGVDEDLEDDDEHIQQNPVQVGFHGLGANYTRRRGPDGEEQDIIGAYGHTEQLPPYSRYPDEGPEKVPLLMPTALHSRAPVAGTDPTMPLMHTVIQPEPVPVPQSMTDLSQLQRQSTASLALLSSPESDDSWMDKRWKEKSWQEKRRTRFIGVPFIWLCAAAAAITFILAIIAGVMGGYLAGKNNPSNISTVTVVSSLFDASIIASPTGQGPPTGTFALSLGTPTETYDSCLPQASQKDAWDCDLVPNQQLGIAVTSNGFNNGTGASIFYASVDERIMYGSQIWNMETTYADFLTVRDNDDPENGPAFYFQQFYDKIVVLPEDAFDPVSGKVRRGASQMLKKDAAGMPLPGDLPWFCVFNDTSLEGFIYVQQKPATSTSSSTTTPPPTSANPSTTNSQYAHQTAFPTPGALYTTIITDASTTTTITGTQSGFPSSFSIESHRQDDDDDDAGNRVSGVVAPREFVDKRGTPPLWSSLPQLPFLIKLEERRTGNQSVAPYCQQYQILWNHAANWKADANGQPIIVPLQEEDPSWQEYQSAGIAGRAVGMRRRDLKDSCHCQWMVGQAP